MSVKFYRCCWHHGVCVCVCMRMWEMVIRRGQILRKFKDSWCSRANDVEKHVKICVRRGKSCENPTIFGTVGPKMWNVGISHQKTEKSCEKPKDNT